MGKRADSKILHRLNATHVSIFKAHAGMGAVILEGHEIDAVVRYIEALELDAARRTTPDREAWISVSESVPQTADFVLAVLGSIDVIDFHNCISNAGKCRVSVAKEAK
ncbi:hypothetical protein [Burkholderia multivorans]|uniref:hypothetical protein n=1 Tax=Burkholderia multivorans TaxID=87883 RepID=UPI0021BE3FE8|nr:hypothetical protein [Burkholderia multivorans]